MSAPSLAISLYTNWFITPRLITFWAITLTLKNAAHNDSNTNIPWWYTVIWFQHGFHSRKDLEQTKCTAWRVLWYSNLHTWHKMLLLMRSSMACVFRDVVQCLFVGHVFFHLHSFCCCHNCIFDLKEACRRKVNHQHTFDLCWSYIYVIFELNIQILLHHNSVDGSCHTSDNRR